MKKIILTVVQWLIPGALVVMGVLLYGSAPTSFLGLICFGLAVLISGYLGIHILSRKELMLAKIFNSILSGIVAFGVLAAAITGLFVGTATLGDYEQEQDYVLVLGAKVNGTEPSQILRQRIHAAHAYLVYHPDAIAILSGGQGSDEGISEAQCMFNELTALGVEPQRLWLEEQATSTWENLNYSLELIEQKTGSRPEKIALVSNEFHLFRATTFAQECGVDSVGIPAWTENRLHFVNYFLREIAGVWYYYILGG